MPKTLEEIFNELKQDLGKINASRDAHVDIIQIIDQYKRTYVPKESKNKEESEE